jgi:flagellar hook-associated protein 3 FlgL
MRVPTNMLHNSNLQRMQDANTNLATTSYQVTSGFKAKRFEEIASDVNQLLRVQDLQLNTDTYVKNIDNATARLKGMENALNSLTDLLVDAANLYTQARNENPANVRATLVPKAQGLADSFFTTLNTTYEGKYLFSGQGSERQPITASLSPTAYPGDPPPTAYYTGDTNKLGVVTAPGVSDTYGVTGDQLGFARIKAGLEALTFGLQNNSEVDLDGAINLLRQAQKDVADMLGQVGGDMAGFDLVKTRHENSQIFMQERNDELEKVDVAEAMTRFTQEQTALEASMAVSSRLSQLSLLNFLR